MRYIYALFAIAVIYAIYKERQALGCGNFFEGSDCDNKNGKAVKGTAPQKDDDISTLLKRIRLASDYQSRFVQWRANFLVAVLTLLVLWFVLYKRIPSEWELLTGTIILTAMFSFMNSFYKFHLCDHVKKHIEQCTDQINRLVRSDIG